MSISSSSTSTPPSFIDDGIDFASRNPTSAQIDIPQWIDSSSAITILNTNSYIDDGADLLLPDACAGPAFGPRNPRYYEDGGPKWRTKKGKDKGKEKIYPDVLRAADAQIKNLLRAKREVGRFKPRAGDGEGNPSDENSGGKGKEGNNGGSGGLKPVRIQLRKRQPTFVLHGEGGHVVVVDDEEDDPIDSRPPAELVRLRRGHARERRSRGDGQ